MKSLIAALMLLQTFTADATIAIVDYLEDDLSFLEYNALNLIKSESDINGAEWVIKNNGGASLSSTRVGSILTLHYPASFYQRVFLVANEKYILTFTGIGTNFDLVRLRVLDSISRDLITYEYLSMRDELYTYSISFTPDQTASYDIEILSMPDLKVLTIDWGAMGLFLESDLIEAGAKWSNFSVWADSMGLNWPAQLKARLGVPEYIDGAVGGEKSSGILARALIAESYGDIAIIWAGNNNSWDSATVISDIYQIISLLPHDKYVVLSLHNNAFYDNTTQTYADVIEINNYLSNNFGDRYIDTRSYLISQADINDVNDLADASAGVVPRSLRSDSIHLNWAGKNLVADLVVARIDALYGDSDGDGIDNADDNCPIISNIDQINSDTDTLGNECDDDDDNDGVLDDLDIFPLDASESIDTDVDGLGNNADSDDDNDGVLDVNDEYPLDPSKSTTETNNGGSLNIYYLISIISLIGIARRKKKLFKR